MGSDIPAPVAAATWSDNAGVAALDQLARALDTLAAEVPSRQAADAGSGGPEPLPLQNLPAHLIFARHWEQHRREFLARLTSRPCPLCGGADRTTWFHTQDGYRYDICACGMVHIPEVLPLPVWDEYYRTLPVARECLQEQMLRSVSEGVMAADRERFGRYFSLLRANGAAAEGARLLDLGSFTGASLRVAAEHGLEASGIEGLAEAVRFARERFPTLNLIHARSEELDPAMAGGPVDVVTMWETLEHTLDPVGSLRLAAQALRPGGVIALTVPNARNVQFSALGQFCFYAYGGYQGTGHINMFTPQTLEKALTKAGFELTYLGTEFGTDWRQLLLYLRHQFDRVHCYANLVRQGDWTANPTPELSVLLNWLSPALTRLENSLDAGPIILACARKT